MSFNFLIALHHMSAESNASLCTRRLGAQSLLIPVWSQEVSLHKDCSTVQVFAFRFVAMALMLMQSFAALPPNNAFSALDRWVASGGDNKVCSCCETSCGTQRWKRSLAANDGTVCRSDATWQPGTGPEHVMPAQWGGNYAILTTFIMKSICICRICWFNFGKHYFKKVFFVKGLWLADTRLSKMP